MTYEAVRTISVTPQSALLPARRAVTINSSGEAILATANATPVGITLEESPANEQNAIPIALLDGAIVEIESGSTTIAVGDNIAIAGASADAGRANDTAAGTTVRYIGVALSAASAAGQVVSVLTATQVGFATQA